MTKEKYQLLADFKYKPGDYFGSELTKLNSADSEEISLYKTQCINEGIGCIIAVKFPNVSKVIYAVLEDNDLDTDKENPRYIFSYFDIESDKIVIIDTLYDRGYEIVKGLER